MWKTLSRRVDKIEQKLYVGGSPDMKEQMRFFGTLDIAQVHILQGWFNRYQCEGIADEETLRQHLTAYDENGTIFDYDSGEYRQPAGYEQCPRGEP